MKKLTTALAIALCACGTVCAQSFSEAKALYSKGEYGKAKTAFAKLLRKSPSSAAYNYWHGLACLKTNDLEAAAGSLEKAAKRKYADSQFVLGRVNTIRYDFDAAVGNFETYAEQLDKDKGSADERARCDLALRQAKDARMMMLGVERVNVIDSVVMDKADFLSIYRLGEGAGSLHCYAGFFGVQRDSADERVVYETELRNAIVYSDYHDGGLALYRSSRDGDGWAAGRIMPEEITGGGSQNYPYLLSDGLTIYYASDGEGSIGGYDIFVTAYSTASDSYMQPQNVGMPFNSIYNDYMYAIDEQNNLGWFASDRYQPEGKVCVYVFVPNGGKVVYDPAGVEPATLVKAATLVGFHDVQPSAEAVAAGLQRLKDVLASAGQGEERADFVFDIDDTRTYTSVYDFMSKEAQELFAKLCRQREAYDGLRAKLDGMRERYHSSSDAQREKMRPSIIDTERRVEEMRRELERLTVQVRNAEITKLKTMNAS